MKYTLKILAFFLLFVSIGTISCSKYRSHPMIHIYYPSLPSNERINVSYIFINKNDAGVMDTIKLDLHGGGKEEYGISIITDIDYFFEFYMKSKKWNYDSLTFIMIPENTPYRDTISDIVVEAPGTDGNIVTSFKLNGVHLFGCEAHSTGRSY